MHSPALALSWELWRRHRWGLAGVATLVASFALASAIAPLPVNLASGNSFWLVLGLCYVIGVFAYGFEGRLEAAESGFPIRLFVLPVRTWMLVGWPMLQGMATAVLLWLGWDWFVLRPSGVATPAWWPAMLAAVVAISQTMVWLPFGLPWLRLPITIGVLVVLVRAPLFLALTGIEFTGPKDEERLLIALAASLIPAAFLVAWRGVARARRGGDRDWLWAMRSVGPERALPRRAPFASPLRAQVWYEWRIRGSGFVVLVACVLAALLVLAILIQRQIGWTVADNLAFLMVPFLLAPFWGSWMSGESIRAGALTAFAATRPMKNTALVDAKFRAAGLAALASWGLAIAVAAGWLFWTGGQGDLQRLWNELASRHGNAKTLVGCSLIVVGSILMTWRILVVGQWAGLTGRAWPVAGQTAFFTFLSLQVLYELALWNTDLDRRERVRSALPWIAGAAIALKIAAAAWAAQALVRRGEIRREVAVRALLVWCAFAAALFTLLDWLIPEGLVPSYGLALGVALLIPLGRLAMAPLALGWNRHR
jgi:hypothetical protein